MTPRLPTLDELVPGDVWFQHPLPLFLRSPGSKKVLNVHDTFLVECVVKGPVFVVSIQHGSFDDELPLDRMMTYKSLTVQGWTRFRARRAFVITADGVFETHLKEPR